MTFLLIFFVLGQKWKETLHENNENTLKVKKQIEKLK